MTDQPNAAIPFPDLPEGTVTFLFTDIEGSTQLLKALCEFIVIKQLHGRIFMACFEVGQERCVSTSAERGSQGF